MDLKFTTCGDYMNDLETSKTEFRGKFYDDRHGGPFDRGAADSYYGRRRKPHFYTGGTGTSTLVPQYGMSMEAIEEYHAGYDYNEERGDKKEW